MSKAEFTPGPWKWSEAIPLPGVKPEPLDPNPKCWRLDADIDHPDGGECVVRHRAPWKVEPANAHLIAAAPEMYDMLATIENDAGQVPDWLWDQIQATLAKARGEAT